MDDLSVPDAAWADVTARLVGARVSLRPVGPRDYDFLFSIGTAPENIHRWRFRSAPPSPDQFAQTLYQGVLVQYLGVRRSDAKPIGLASLYNADLRSGTAWLSTILAPAFEAQGWALEMVGLFLRYCFDSWPLRQIYMEMLEFNYERIAAGRGRLFEVEGCLKEHEFLDGKYWHKYFLTIRRAGFDSYVSDFAPHLEPKTDAR